MKNLKQFSKAVLENGGATFNIATGEHEFKGYGYSIFGHEKVHDAIDGAFTLSDVEKAVREYVAEKGIELHNEDNHLGAWFDDGKLFLDITNTEEDKRTAIVNGINNGQLAIYDFKKGKDIVLPTPQIAGTITQGKSYMRMKINELVNEN